MVYIFRQVYRVKRSVNTHDYSPSYQAMQDRRPFRFESMDYSLENRSADLKSFCVYFCSSEPHPSTARLEDAKECFDPSAERRSLTI